MRALRAGSERNGERDPPPGERVRCLECGHVYAKPAVRGTAGSNPGCPVCGYIGWADAAAPVTPAMLRNRSDAGRPPHPRDRPR